MGSRALYVKDPQTSRFVAGGLAEAEVLLGSPLPVLPPVQLDRGQPAYVVKSHQLLRSHARKLVQGLLAQIGLDTGTSPSSSAARRAESAEKEQLEYEALLTCALKAARLVDRRLGITNLFWLAHTREVAEVIRELEGRLPLVRKAKYSLHPLLSSFYRRINQTARRDVARSDPERNALVIAGHENSALVDSLLDDGFAFTELSIADFDFNQYLAANKRYRISTELFFEVFALLTRETERRIREGDRLLMARVGRHLPGLQRDQWLNQPGLTKIMLNAHVLSFLLADAWNTGAKLQASARLKAEGDRRRPIEILDVFLDLVAGVKRFEIISGIRERVVLLQSGDREMDERAHQGLRVYEFGEATHVLNNAVNATVLFLDLRGFTKTSEGQISERDLTQELYTVFDTFVPVIRRFGGTIDKFLGDGMMVTFGTSHADPLDPLNAVRVAILCQEALRRLRQEGKTYFKMGVAIHHGRVYLARFIADEESIQSTVIGRNVNLAGRLSSAAKRPLDEDEEAQAEAQPQASRPSGLMVTIDSSGTLINEGIAISRDTLAQIENHLPLTHIEDQAGRQLEYFDESLGRKMVIRYAGDAKFKGVRSSFPVHDVDYE